MELKVLLCELLTVITENLFANTHFPVIVYIRSDILKILSEIATEGIYSLINFHFLYNICIAAQKLLHIFQN